MHKLLLTIFLAFSGVSASAANWQGVYELIDSALAAQQQAATHSSTESDPNAIQYSAQSASTLEQPVIDETADSLLRQYLFNASDETLLALIDEKDLDNDLVERFQSTVDSGDRRLTRLVRNRVIDMLAQLYPYKT